MIAVDVRSNVGEVLAEFRAFREDVEEKAAMRALNRAAVTVRAEAARGIRKVYEIKAGAIKDQMAIRNATRENLKAVLRVRGGRIPLMEFGSPRQTRTGVSVTIKKGSRVTIRHAFIATTKSGHRGVFARAPTGKSGAYLKFRFGKGSRLRPSGPDLPIAQLTSVSIPQAFLNDAVLSAVRSIARSEFVKNFRHELNFRAARAA